jgi:hypothetical protein
MKTLLSSSQLFLQSNLYSNVTAASVETTIAKSHYRFSHGSTVQLFLLNWAPGLLLLYLLYQLLKNIVSSRMRAYLASRPESHHWSYNYTAFFMGLHMTSLSGVPSGASQPLSRGCLDRSPAITEEIRNLLRLILSIVSGGGDRRWT